MILLALGVAVAGGLGAAARFVLDSLLARRAGLVPRGLMVINISGSLLLGLVAGLATHVLSDDWRLILGTGFLGGYTTFSSAAYETIQLLRARKTNAALITGILMLLASIAAAFGGYALGILL